MAQTPLNRDALLPALSLPARECRWCSQQQLTVDRPSLAPYKWCHGQQQLEARLLLHISSKMNSLEEKGRGVKVWISITSILGEFGST